MVTGVDEQSRGTFQAESLDVHDVGLFMSTTDSFNPLRLKSSKPNKTVTRRGSSHSQPSQLTRVKKY